MSDFVNNIIAIEHRKVELYEKFYKKNFDKNNLNKDYFDKSASPTANYWHDAGKWVESEMQIYKYHLRNLTSEEKEKLKVKK